MDGTRKGIWTNMIPKPEKRIYDFERYGLGMFIHYGLYSIIGEGEWAQDFQKIPVDEYAKLADQFTAENFSGENFAKTAHDFGAKYITLTTRHHDGFSLYDTRGLNTFDAPHTPAKRDLIEDFVEGCQKYDIIPFFYHTTLDWRVPEFQNDFPAYQQYLRESIKILCTNYGKVGGFWFDGNWSKDADWEEDALYGLIRQYQPDAMIINNTGLTKQGETGHYEIDAVTFERGKPFPINKDGARKYLGSEVCQIFNAHWGRAKNDFGYRAVRDLIVELAECRKYGANFLLNVGPEADGSIRPIERGMLHEIGKWTKIFDEALHKVRPAEGVECDNDSFLLKADEPNTYYLFVPRLGIVGSPNVVKNPENLKKVNLHGFDKTIKEVKWIDNGEDLNVINENGEKFVECTQYAYGTNLVVRVAKIIAE